MCSGTINFGETDYQRGYRDGQNARKKNDYERGYRDGYGAPWPQAFPVYPMPYYPAIPMWGDSGTFRFTPEPLPVTCTFN